jgi:hypothetical protein
MEAVKLIKPNLLQSKIFLVSLFVGKNLGSLNKKKKEKKQKKKKKKNSCPVPCCTLR